MSYKKRSFNIFNMPLNAYNTHTWFFLYCTLYKKYNKSKFMKYNHIEKKYEHYSLPYVANFISREIYPKVFYDDNRNWSAKNLIDFLIFSIKESVNNEKQFTLFTFREDRNNNLIQTYINNFDEKIKFKQENDLFEKISYCKFENLSNHENNLITVIEPLEEKPITIMYNFGIPIYIRYLQLKDNKLKYNFEDAKKIAKTSIKDFLLQYEKNEKEMTIKILKGIAKNSALWEPYIEKKSNCSVFDWRNELQGLWNVLKFKEEIWWKDYYYTKKWPMLTSTKKLFKE